MDFGISSNFTLSTFQGTTISIGKFISDHQKYRIGISTSVNSNSADQNADSFTADTLVSRSKQNSETDSYSLQLSFQYLTYATPNAHTSFYFGIGPFGGIGWDKNNNGSTNYYVNTSQDRTNSNSSRTNYSIGILGSLGVEWFFSENISLHAEYGLAATYIWSKNESTNKNGTTSPYTYYASNKNTNSSSTSNWSLAGQKILFGLSINY
jgi:hypothetical protein